MDVRKLLRILLLIACGLPVIVLASDVLTRKPSIPKTESECVARGGQWIFAGPQNIVKYCLLKTADVGKACKKSSDCQSECVETAQGNQCAGWFTGCFEPTGRGTVTECVN